MSGACASTLPATLKPRHGEPTGRRMSGACASGAVGGRGSREGSGRAGTFQLGAGQETAKGALGAGRDEER